MQAKCELRISAKWNLGTINVSMNFNLLGFFMFTLRQAQCDIQNDVLLITNS